jgi:hypothetical protein
MPLPFSSIQGFFASSYIMFDSFSCHAQPSPTFLYDGASQRSLLMRQSSAYIVLGYEVFFAPPFDASIMMIIRRPGSQTRIGETTKDRWDSLQAGFLGLVLYSKRFTSYSKAPRAIFSIKNPPVKSKCLKIHPEPLIFSYIIPQLQVLLPADYV